MNNNVVILDGEIAAKPRYIKTVENGLNLFEVFINVRRNSGTDDLIAVLVNDTQIELDELYIGTKVFVCGEYRSRNKEKGVRVNKTLYVLAESIQFSQSLYHFNEIKLNNSFIISTPYFKKTFKGKLITEFKVAVKRINCNFVKHDYIECIAWGLDALEVSRMEVGSVLNIEGRIQSRTYVKDGKEYRVNELSVSKIIK